MLFINFPSCSNSISQMRLISYCVLASNHVYLLLIIFISTGRPNHKFNYDYAVRDEYTSIRCRYTVCVYSIVIHIQKKSETPHNKLWITMTIYNYYLNYCIAITCIVMDFFWILNTRPVSKRNTKFRALVYTIRLAHGRSF